MFNSDVGKAIGFVGTIALVVIILLSFHFVNHPKGVSSIPKESLTFRLTFPSLDQVIDEYNNKNLIHKANDDLLINLTDSLRSRDLITIESGENLD